MEISLKKKKGISRIAKDEASKGKYQMRGMVETEFAKDCSHNDLVIMRIIILLICIYSNSTK